jgi:hypothetical protein
LLKNNFPRPSSSGIIVWTSLPVETRKSLSESSNGENKSLFGNNTVGDYSFTGPNLIKPEPKLMPKAQRTQREKEDKPEISVLSVSPW